MTSEESSESKAVKTAETYEPTRDDLILLDTIFMNDWVPFKPTLKQAAFLRCNAREALFGGAAGPGKSWSLLMAALQYVSEPHYNALILRRTYKHLSLPGALMDISKKWLLNLEVEGEMAHWDAVDKQWTFPSGSTISFGYLANQADWDQYQGSQWQFIGFDELTQFNQDDYMWLYSRNRTVKNDPIPLRLWSTSNPGGRGHNWVKERFILSDNPEIKFIPAKIYDNPYLDADEYAKTLSNLSSVMKRQLLYGDWDAVNTGGYFHRHWFKMLPPDFLPSFAFRVRFWDLAATPVSSSNADPDWTAGALVSMQQDGTYTIEDVSRTRDTAQNVERLVRYTADCDHPETLTIIEQEPGASGKQVIDYYHRHVLPDKKFMAYKPSGPKATRVSIVSNHAEAGNISLMRDVESHKWNDEFLNEAELFPDGNHDDQLDAVAGAFAILQLASRRGKVRWFGGSNQQQIQGGIV
jgi:predicted phage terminase large subunit-like protein